MAVGRARQDSAVLGGTVGGYAPLDSNLLVPKAYIPSYAIAVTTSTGSPTTTSTSFVDLTGMSVTLTTGAHRVLIGFTGACYGSGANNVGMLFDVVIDGTSVSSGTGVSQEWTVTNGADAHSIAFTWMSGVLSAASHTIKIQWKVASQTGNMYGGSMHLWAAEQLA